MNDQRLLEFHAEPNSGSYRGFRQLNPTRIQRETGITRVILSDGEIEISAEGDSRKDALVSAFDKIDAFLK